MPRRRHHGRRSAARRGSALTPVPSFRYRALTQAGEIVSGSISAPSTAEVVRQVEYLGLVPIDTITEAAQAEGSRFSFAFFTKPRAEDVTIFTRDLALLLKSGARLDAALDLLASDFDIGRLRPIIGKIRASILGGESLAEAISHHPATFPSIYVALVRVGEATGTLDHVLEVLAGERERAAAVRQKVADATRYPAFLLFAASCVLTFFLLFVLPQFASFLRESHAKLDPIVTFFLGLSDLLRAHGDLFAAFAAMALASVWLLARRTDVKRATWNTMARLPLAKSLLMFYTTGLFCRNLGLLLTSGLTLSAALRILIEMMNRRGEPEAWQRVADRVRHGGKLSDALADADALPAMAVRMLRLGEETGQLAALSSRVAEFYEVKLQRSVDRIVGIVGPAAIIGISVVVGGLIVSVMTSLLSVSQIVAS
jgi:general secretion pathway protein F